MHFVHLDDYSKSISLIWIFWNICLDWNIMHWYRQEYQEFKSSPSHTACWRPSWTMWNSDSEILYVYLYMHIYIKHCIINNKSISFQNRNSLISVLKFWNATLIKCNPIITGNWREKYNWPEREITFSLNFSLDGYHQNCSHPFCHYLATFWQEKGPCRNFSRAAVCSVNRGRNILTNTLDALCFVGLLGHTDAMTIVILF